MIRYVKVKNTVPGHRYLTKGDSKGILGGDPIEICFDVNHLKKTGRLVHRLNYDKSKIFFRIPRDNGGFYPVGKSEFYDQIGLHQYVKTIEAEAKNPPWTRWSGQAHIVGYMQKLCDIGVELGFNFVRRHHYYSVEYPSRTAKRAIKVASIYWKGILALPAKPSGELGEFSIFEGEIYSTAAHMPHRILLPIVHINAQWDKFLDLWKDYLSTVRRSLMWKDGRRSNLRKEISETCAA
jgi:hypothetical protein